MHPRAVTRTKSITRVSIERLAELPLFFICMAETVVTREDIAQGLTLLGLQPGDVVVAHASLSSFGRVEGGADAVVSALLDVLGSAGTLVVPTFTRERAGFDASNTPSACGAVTEAARTRPGAKRSLHPTHSVAAIGPLAESIVEGAEQAHPFGRGSALFRVLQARGKILQLGTTHTSNSIIHVAEELAGVGYLDRSVQVAIRTASGKTVRKWIRRPGCSLGFGAIEESMQAKGAISEVQIGRCRARLMAARAVVDAAVEALKSDPEALLCDRPECGLCAEARAALAALQVEAHEKEIIEMAEEDERTVRLIERQLNGPVTYFDPDSYDHSPN